MALTSILHRHSNRLTSANDRKVLLVGAVMCSPLVVVTVVYRGFITIAAKAVEPDLQKRGPVRGVNDKQHYDTSLLDE